MIKETASLILNRTRMPRIKRIATDFQIMRWIFKTVAIRLIRGICIVFTKLIFIKNFKPQSSFHFQKVGLTILLQLIGIPYFAANSKVVIQNFKNFIQTEQLFQSDEKVLLAVSGGVDSVVMSHLFAQSKMKFGIAHCNFKLRKKASDEDAFFVKKLAQSFQIPFFEISFETEKFASENKLSIQVAARELRYEWLEKIRLENDFHYIATAHHSDDSLETVLYNFTKGCGIRGLHGILPKKNKIIRPLLFSSKNEILDFSKDNKIDFCEDASNATDKYVRNQIRHHVIPLLQKINPALQKTAIENIDRLRETEILFDFAIRQLKNEICEEREKQVFIHLKKLQNSPAPSTLLFEILNPFGFNNSNTSQMLDSIGHQSGAIFHSSTHEVLLDREFFILKKNTPSVNLQFLIAEKDSEIIFPAGQLFLKKIESLPNDFLKNKNIAFFDLDKITFPLTLRKWKAGDHFQPFGMNGQTKKVKNFLKDLKLTRFEKEDIWVLESDGKICWVIGLRSDERFRVNENSKKILQLTLD